jgi:hypothetical protein
VSALQPGGSHDSGNYFLGVDTTTEPVTALTGFASGRLTASAPQTWSTLTVTQNRLYEFILSAAAAGQAEVRLDIFNAAGTVVFTLRSYAGVPASTGHIYLTAGTYRLLFSAAAPPGNQLPAVDFALSGRVVSDPIGPRKDPGTDPAKPGADGDTVAGSDPSAPPPSWDQPYYA